MFVLQVLLHPVLRGSNHVLSFRQKLHEDWLAVERNAQEEFERRKLEEERRKNERLEQEVLLIVRGAEEGGQGGRSPLAVT